MKNKKIINKEKGIRYILFVLASLVLLEILFGSFFVSLLTPIVSGGVGENVTVTTTLEVGEVYPEVLNTTFNNDASITLTANSTKLVNCVALVRDYNNDTDITYAGAEVFDVAGSSPGNTTDNNYHYTNFSCNISYDFGTWRSVSDDNYTALVNCSFWLQYYSNPGVWNCSLEINDTTDRHDNGTATANVSELLAVELPETINYGIVNSTEVSSEQIANVSNAGNVALNLSLSGYAVTEEDDYAMSCEIGDNTSFNIYYEKYNLSNSTAGDLSLTEFENTYTNLTSTPVVNELDLYYRQDDGTNDAINSTYWRIYVPRGVAGTCSGNIVFGATQSVAP